MMSDSEGVVGPQYGDSIVARRRWTPRPGSVKGRVLVVEDEEVVRDALEPLLEEEGYEVSLAENGREALRRLHTESLPDIIVLDLRMPVMDGWEFRTIQKDDPKLGHIPVVAVSADGSAQAAAIAAQAFLRKPVDAQTLVSTIGRILLDNGRQVSVRLHETERLASLGRLAANVGHEINNPLTFVMLNLSHSLETLRPSIRSPEASWGIPCQIGGERIRETVRTLQRLSHRGEEGRPLLDVHKLIEQSVSMVWNHIRPRARLIKSFGTIPSLRGNGTALGQVFLNLLVNAAQAIPEGQVERNEIRVSTNIHAGENGAELVVEISDSGQGIAPEIMSQVFEPFFTTKPIGQGTGLGLSISRQTVNDHGGRITAESEPGKGTVFRVFLPLGDFTVPHRPVAASASQVMTGGAVTPGTVEFMERVRIDRLKQLVSERLGGSSNG
jgi:signal transduction histidine kinase